MTEPILVLEGPDGSGKTTAARVIVARLAAAGRPVEYVRLPGGTPLGELLREPLKDASFDLSPLEKTLLFMAVDEAGQRRAETLAASGVTVVMDRCAISNWAYRFAQGEREMSNLVTREIIARGRAWPRGATVVFLDASDGELSRRIREGRDPTSVAADRFDGIALKAAAAYRHLVDNLASAGWHRIVTDGMTPGDVATEAMRLGGVDVEGRLA